MSGPRCVICQRECIPLADYDAPTCISCDARLSDISIAAAASTRTVTVYLPADKRPAKPSRRTNLAACGTHAAFNRHRSRHEPIDDACRLGERTYQTERARRERAQKRSAAA